MTIENELKSHISGFRNNQFVGDSGEIRLTVYHGDYYLEFTIETDDTISYLCEDGGEEDDYQEGLSLNEAIEIINSFKQSIGITVPYSH